MTPPKKGPYAACVRGGSVKIFDNVMPVLVFVLLGLRLPPGVEYLSFTTGLLVGMTVIRSQPTGLIHCRPKISNNPSQR